MRDRTLIMLALLFLTLTISSGVNKALVECNKIAGQPMAPEPVRIYKEKMPVVIKDVKVMAQHGADRSKEIISRKYPMIRENYNQVKVKVNTEIETGKDFVDQRISELVSRVRDFN